MEPSRFEGSCPEYLRRDIAKNFKDIVKVWTENIGLVYVLIVSL